MYLYSSRGAYSLIGTCAKKCNNTVSHSSTTSAPLPPAQVSDRCVTCQCYLCYPIMPRSPATRISHASATSAPPPSAAPSMAASVGTGRQDSSYDNCRADQLHRRYSASFCARRSFKSAPAHRMVFEVLCCGVLCCV